MGDMSDLTALASDLAASVNWPQLESALGTLAEQALIPLLEGDAADIRTFAQAIGKDMVAAILTGDDAWHAQLVAQLKVLAEISRVRTNADKWVFAGQAISLIFKSTIAALSVVVPKI